MKKVPIFILLVTSAICSKVFFLSINDPEGANLLINVVITGAIFFASFMVYRFSHRFTDLQKLLLAILAQIVLLIGLIFFLH